MSIFGRKLAGRQPDGAGRCLRGNPRLGIALQAAKRRDPGRRRSDRALSLRVRERLLAGEMLRPESPSAAKKKRAGREAGGR